MLQWQQHLSCCILASSVSELCWLERCKTCVLPEGNANQAHEHSSNMQRVLIYSQHDTGIITNHDVTASASMAEFAYEHGKILSAAAYTNLQTIIII